LFAIDSSRLLLYIYFPTCRSLLSTDAHTDAPLSATYYRPEAPSFASFSASSSSSSAHVTGSVNSELGTPYVVMRDGAVDFSANSSVGWGQASALGMYVAGGFNVRWAGPPLQHTATHCNTLQRTAAYCNRLHHVAYNCIVLQHTATLCIVRQHAATWGRMQRETILCGRQTPLYTATHCITLQLIATLCIVLQHACTRLEALLRGGQ